MASSAQPPAALISAAGSGGGALDELAAVEFEDKVVSMEELCEGPGCRGAERPDFICVVAVDADAEEADTGDSLERVCGVAIEH